MTAVMIGVDPAKRSHAMAVLDGNENEQAVLQVRNDNDGYREMLRLAKRWPQRSWAVEGAGGVGVQLAQRLVADGETVVDVPPKLATRARIFDIGHGRKNDPGDARTVAVVALRTKGLRQVVPDERALPAAFLGRTVASSALALLAVNFCSAPAGSSSISSWCKWFTVLVRDCTSSRRRSDISRSARRSREKPPARLRATSCSPTISMASSTRGLAMPCVAASACRWL